MAWVSSVLVTGCGAVRFTGPHPVTNTELTHAMGHALHRPTALPVPAFALKAVLGEFSTEVLNSARVLPTALQNDGFTFHHPDIDSAVATIA